MLELQDKSSRCKRSCLEYGFLQLESNSVLEEIFNKCLSISFLVTNDQRDLRVISVDT